MAQDQLGLEMYCAYPEKCILPWCYNLWLGTQKGENISRRIPVLLGDPHLVTAAWLHLVFHPFAGLLSTYHLWPGISFCITYWKGLPRQSSSIAFNNVIIIRPKCIISNASCLKRYPTSEKFLKVFLSVPTFSVIQVDVSLSSQPSLPS